MSYNSTTSVSTGASLLLPLSKWIRLGSIATGVSVVLLTMMCVLCVVCPSCLCHKFFFKERRRHEEGGRKPRGAAAEYGSTVVRDEELELQPRGRGKRSLALFSGTAAAAASEKRKKERERSQEAQQAASAAFAGGAGDPEQPHSPLQRHEKKEIMSRPSTSSVESGGVGGKRRDSASQSSLSSAFSALSFVKQASSDGPNPPTVVLNVSLVKLDQSGEGSSVIEDKTRLLISVQEVRDLPQRDSGLPPDPFLKLSLYRDRRSLRRKTKQTLAEIKTSTAKHERHPKFDPEVFALSADVVGSEYKHLRLKITVFDADRHTKTAEIGSSSLSLKEIKELDSAASGSKSAQVNQVLTRKRSDFGEILFGMSYLPTAQRLSFTIVKAVNLKYGGIVQDLQNFIPYVRVLQLTPHGRVIRKKKTSPRPGSKDPHFNETINFELGPDQLDSAVFLVLLSHRQTAIEMHEFDSSSAPHSLLTDRSDTSSDTPTTGAAAAHQGQIVVGGAVKDVCLGQVCIGGGVHGERERAHWSTVLQAPRKMATQWHTLH